MSNQTRSIPAAVRRHIDFHAGKDCCECGREIDGEKLVQHIDHILPRSLGGENAIFNLEPLCHECNLRKSNSITPRVQKLIDLKNRRKRELRHSFQQTPANSFGNVSDAFDALRKQGFCVPDAEKLKSNIIQMNRPSGTGDLPQPNNRPDKERQARRSKLNSTVKKAAGRLVQTMGIDGSAADLVAPVGNGEESKSYEAVIRALNRRLNRAMGKDGSNSKRNDWLADEFKQAEKRLSEVEEALVEHIEAQTDYRRERPGFNLPTFLS